MDLRLNSLRKPCAPEKARKETQRGFETRSRQKRKYGFFGYRRVSALQNLCHFRLYPGGTRTMQPPSLSPCRHEQGLRRICAIVARDARMAHPASAVSISRFRTSAFICAPGRWCSTPIITRRIKWLLCRYVGDVAQHALHAGLNAGFGNIPLRKLQHRLGWVDCDKIPIWPELG